MIPFTFICPSCGLQYGLELEGPEQKAQCECGTRVMLKVGPPPEIVLL